MKKEEFIKDVSNWDNHRLLLWPSLEETKYFGFPVLELGTGEGSTPFLQQYCKDNGIELLSYDFNAGWAHKFGSNHVTNWDNIPWRKEFSVALVDHSPGEHRKIAIERLINTKIIVVHDSEPAGWNASDYQVRSLFDKFKYVKDFESPSPGAWATALSNEVDVTKFKV